MQEAHYAMSTTAIPNSASLDFASEDRSWIEVASTGGILPEALRTVAIERFREIGLPTTRDEEWRLTNLDAIRRADFVLEPAPPAPVTKADVERLAVPGLDALRLVFVNGRFAPALSDATISGPGGVVERLADAVAKNRPGVADRLGRLLDPDLDAFTALNSALSRDGVFVHVPKGQALERAVYVLNISVSGDEPAWSSPRNLIVVESNASATVIEDYISLSEGDVHLTNAVTEADVAAEGELHHYLLERENESAFNITTLRARQGDRSRFSSHSALFGGALVRNNVRPCLAGDRCFSLLNGLYVGRGEQHFDNVMRVEHDSTAGDSRQYYKGILDGSAHGVFAGRIRVAQAAQKTDAKQSNQSLLLSDSARSNTRPQLEIYADDVKCTHGATIGELNDEAIFYLQARGIPVDQARAILVHAFANECLERMECEPVRALLEHLLVSRLPGGADMIESAGEF